MSRILLALALPVFVALVVPTTAHAQPVEVRAEAVANAQRDVRTALRTGRDASRAWALERDAELRPLRAMHAARRRQPGLDAPFYEALRHTTDSMMAGDLPVSESRLRALQSMAPGWPGLRHLEHRNAVARIERLLEQGGVHEAVQAAQNLLYEHGGSEENRVIVRRTRQARLDAALQRHTDSPSRWLLAWEDALAVARLSDAPDITAFETIAARFFENLSQHPMHDAYLLEIVRHVDALAVTRPSGAVTGLQAWVHYQVAAHEVARHGFWMGSEAIHRAERHLNRARSLGFLADPLQLGRHLWLVRMSPALLPIGFLGLLGTIGWYAGGGRRRRGAHAALRASRRLRLRGRFTDSAVAALACVRKLEREPLPNRRDQYALVAAATILMHDALERGDAAQAARWVDRIADQPFELWPDDLDRIATRCGIDLSVRLHDSLQHPP